MQLGTSEAINAVATGNTMSQTAVETPDVLNATQSTSSLNEGAMVSELMEAQMKITVLEKIAEEQARELIRLRAENSYHRDARGHPEDVPTESTLNEMKKCLKGAMRHLMTRKPRPEISEKALDVEVDSSDL